MEGKCGARGLGIEQIVCVCVQFVFICAVVIIRCFRAGFFFGFSQLNFSPVKGFFMLGFSLGVWAIPPKYSSLHCPQLRLYPLCWIR